ncbi:hypothetical protein [Mesorhizobium sp. ANAO-SY3R2]|uniref:hypothetical protein n=1 Tax=Mesorhizobium sp. ANAO-SY3R2 TaxID=3166644 RepID=UPI003670612D
MTDNKPDATDEGAGALLLAPVVDMGSWYGEAGLADLPMLAPSPLPAIDHAALGDILADSLFGEVIEISDLIPQLLESGVEQAVEPAAVPVEPVGAETGGDVFVATLPFTILFEEDGSSGHGTL